MIINQPAFIDLTASRQRAGFESRFRTGAFGFRRPEDRGIDRAAQDRSLSRAGASAGLIGKAQLDVNVKAPRGTRVKASGSGVFEDVRLKQTPQLGTTGGYRSGENNAYAEE